ncbi:MAG: hypothetical protein ACM3JQ_03685, partial [Candidatus Eiseniibacteriota bacterium]
MRSFGNQNRVELVVLGTVTSILLVATAVNFGIGHIFTNAYAQTDMTNNTLFVTGSATNQTKADKVTVSLGVETTNSTAQAALTAN